MAFNDCCYVTTCNPAGLCRKLDNNIRVSVPVHILNMDSIFGGGMNALKPPYVIRVVNTAILALELKDLVHDFSTAIEDTRTRRFARTGEDVAVSLEIVN